MEKEQDPIIVAIAGDLKKHGLKIVCQIGNLSEQYNFPPEFFTHDVVIASNIDEGLLDEEIIFARYFLNAVDEQRRLAYVWTYLTNFIAKQNVSPRMARLLNDLLTDFMETLIEEADLL